MAASQLEGGHYDHRKIHDQQGQRLCRQPHHPHASRQAGIHAAEKGADYQVTLDGIEVGAAWKKTGRESGKAYLSVKLDSPFLPAPVNCALMPQDDGSHILVWNREAKKQA